MSPLFYGKTKTVFMKSHMKPRMTSRFYSLWPLFILMVIVFNAIPAHALSINDIRFGLHPDKTRMVVELDRPVEFKAFVMEGPYRLVLDLPTFRWDVNRVSSPKGSPVKEIRHGSQNASVSRLVIDTKNPVAIRSAFVLPAAAGKPDRLVIDIENVSPATFAQKKDRTFGRLQTDLTDNEPVRTASMATKPPYKPEPTSRLVPRHKPPYADVKPIVVIDPGHGGADPGAVGHNHRREKDITLATAKELKSQLEKTGLYEVHLTRSDDRYIKLHKRVEFAREREADLFISIHADSIDKPSVRGASIYTLSNKASDAQTARLAARENQADLIAGVDLSHEDKEVADILIDLAMRDTMNQSKFLANTLADTMGARGMRLLTKPHRYAGFAVLKAPDVPSVLVEVGFMSNDSEASLLSTPDYRSKVAASLLDGINLYFSKVKKNKRS